MRLAVSRVSPQIRQGAGSSTETSAPASPRRRRPTASKEDFTGPRVIQATGRKQTRAPRAEEAERAEASRLPPVLEQALLLLFLADGAVTGPRHGFQALLLQLGLAIDADAELTVFDALERGVNQGQGAAIGIGLAE